MIGTKNHHMIAAHQPDAPRQHFRLDRSGDQDGDGRIERQHVMRQLGHDQFEHDPATAPATPAESARRARGAPPKPRAPPVRPASRRERTSRRTAASRVPAARHASPARSQSWPACPRRPTRPGIDCRTRMKIAMNHGSTRRTSQAIPASGRSANSQRAERSRIDSVAAASPTTIRMSGPLMRMPTASAVQNTAKQSETAVARGRPGALQDRRAPARPWRQPR